MTEPPIPEIPPEPKLPYRLWWPALEHHATALGYICMNYAALEQQINDFIESALGCSRDQRRAIVDASGSRLEDRCELLKKLLVLRCPSPEFYSDVEGLLKPIGNEISAPRNRLIHDPWIQGETVRQWDFRSKIRQPQAGEDRALTPPDEPERSLESLWSLVQRIQETSVWISMMRMKYTMWRVTGSVPELPELPQHLRKRPDPTSTGAPSRAAPEPPPQS